MASPTMPEERAFCSLETLMTPDKELAAAIARDIFKCGDEFGRSTWRIQFMVGDMHDEREAGGLNEKALTRIIATRLAATAPDAQTEKWKAAGFAVLPKITDEIVEEFDKQPLLELGIGGWEWTQTAVDFACLAAGHIATPAAAPTDFGKLLGEYAQFREDFGYATRANDGALQESANANAGEARAAVESYVLSLHQRISELERKS